MPLRRSRRPPIGGLDDNTSLTERPGRPALEVQALQHEYGSGDTAVHALRGLDLTVLPGTFIAVMGPSGSGKSTLLHLACGLDRPSSGQVLVGGAELTAGSETRRTVLPRRHVGMVFQGFHLVPYLTAAQDVALPIRLAGGRSRPERVRELLDSVGLADCAHRLPAELSGGQQQRVAIARALVTVPHVVLADEPTGALDTRAAREVLTLLRRRRGRYTRCSTS